MGWFLKLSREHILYSSAILFYFFNFTYIGTVVVNHQAAIPFVQLIALVANIIIDAKTARYKSPLYLSLLHTSIAKRPTKRMIALGEFQRRTVVSSIFSLVVYSILRCVPIIHPNIRNAAVYKCSISHPRQTIQLCSTTR